MCPSRATCLPEDCFSEPALLKSNSACWSETKRISSSFHWKLTCSRHDMAENSLGWRKTTITHSLTHSQKSKRFCGVSIIWYVCIYFKMLLISINSLSGSNQYTVFLYVDTYYRNFYWQNVLIHGFLNSWFQALQAIVNGKSVFR